MNFAKDLGNIGASYGNWQKYAGLGKDFIQEITAFPEPKSPVAPPSVDYETKPMEPVDYSLGANKPPVGLGVSPSLNQGFALPSLNKGFVDPLKTPSLLDLVDEYYGVKK